MKPQPMGTISEMFNCIEREDKRLLPLLYSDIDKAAWSIVRSWIQVSLHPEVSFEHPCLLLIHPKDRKSKLNIKSEIPVTSIISELENYAEMLAYQCQLGLQCFHYRSANNKIIFVHRSITHLGCLSTRRITQILAMYNINLLPACATVRLSSSILKPCLSKAIQYIRELLLCVPIVIKSISPDLQQRIVLRWGNFCQTFAYGFLHGFTIGTAILKSRAGVKRLLYDQFMEPFSQGLRLSAKISDVVCAEVVHGSSIEPCYMLPRLLSSPYIYPNYHISMTPEIEYLPLDIRHGSIINTFRTIPDTCLPLPRQAIISARNKLTEISESLCHKQILYVESLQPNILTFNNSQKIAARRLISVIKSLHDSSLRLFYRPHPAIGVTSFVESLLYNYGETIQILESKIPIGNQSHLFDVAMLAVDSSSAFELVSNGIPLIFLYDESTPLSSLLIDKGVALRFDRLRFGIGIS